MNFESKIASPAGVHHDEKPKPRMSISDRLAAKMAERGIVDVVDPSVNTAEDDRVAALVKNVNEKPSVEATPVSDNTQGSEVTVAEIVGETSKDAVVEKTAEKTAEDLAAEDKALREKAMIKAAEKRRAAIGAQRSLVDVRSVLQHIPNAVPMMAKMDKPPMPKIDPFQKIEIPGFGEAQILSIDEESQTLYFATPGERAKVDSQLVKDQGMSSMKAANFENVIAITPEQARQYIAAVNAKRQMSPLETVVPAMVESANTRPQMNRYQLAA